MMRINLFCVIGQDELDNLRPKQCYSKTNRDKAKHNITLKIHWHVGNDKCNKPIDLDIFN